MNYYNSKLAQKKYGDAIETVGLWKSEKLIFNKYVKKDAKILDLGCGAGRTTINLYKIGYNNIIGIDNAKKQLKIAKDYTKKTNLPISFIKCNAKRLPFKNQIFDIAFFSFNGLMTIKKKEKVFDEIYRILKKDGLFIFTVHDKNEINNNIKLKYYVDLTDTEELKKIIDYNKFEILEIKSRKDICKENLNVILFSDNTYFWVIKKL